MTYLYIANAVGAGLVLLLWFLDAKREKRRKILEIEIYEEFCKKETASKF